jgi:hypothetical protein
MLLQDNPQLGRLEFCGCVDPELDPREARRGNIRDGLFPAPRDGGVPKSDSTPRRQRLYPEELL